MRVTSSINFYCRAAKKDKKGMAPIEMAITLNGVRSFMSLPLKERPEVFNQKRQPRHIREYCETWRIKLVDIESELIQNGIPVTPKNIKELVRSGGVVSYTFAVLAKDFLNDLKHRADCQIYRKYELVFKRFQELVGDIEITQITNAQCVRFYNGLLNDYKTQTSAGMMTKIKTLFKFAVSNGKLKINPAENVKIDRGKPEIDFLTEDEVRYLSEVRLDNESLEKSRDIFIFQCCSGLSYCDVCQLEPSDMKIENDVYYVRKKRQKTNVQFTAVIMPLGVEIWKKYNGNLPVISNQKMNLNLHFIESITGFTKRLHTHLARHTASCMLLNSGVRLDVVAECLGHSSTATTKKYYAVLHKETVLSEVSSIFKK